MIYLKPCPFCGNDARIERYGDRRQSTIYQCDYCSCSLETGEEFDHGARWNQRAALSSTSVSADIVNAAWNEGKRRGMTGLPSDFRSVIEVALPTLKNTSAADDDPVAWTLVFNESYGANAETTFKTEATAVDYAKKCGPPHPKVIPLYARPQSAAVRDGWQPEAEFLIHRLGHEDHIYEAFQALFYRGRAAGGFEGETQNLIRELTNAMRDAANWRAETKIALGLEQQMRKEAEAEVQYWINQDEQSQAREADALDTCEKLAKALESIASYPKEGQSRRTEDGYPEELAYDEFAYKRMVDTYRACANDAIATYRKEASE